jgi:hypothetical protein
MSDSNPLPVLPPDAPDFVSQGHFACPCGYFTIRMTSTIGNGTTFVRCPYCGTTCELISGGAE